MSKVSEAKDQQGYRSIGPRCGNCYFFTSDSQPIAWMVRMNDTLVAEGRQPHYDMNIPANQRETNLRCQVGGFKVTKHGCCSQWRDEDA